MVFVFLQSCKKVSEEKLPTYYEFNYSLFLDGLGYDSALVHIENKTKFSFEEFDNVLGSIVVINEKNNEVSNLTNNIDLTQPAYRDSFVYKIKNLTPGVSYKVQLRVSSEFNRFSANDVQTFQSEFTTRPPSSPRIKFSLAKIDYDSVLATYSISDNGGSNCNEVGFFYTPSWSSSVGDEMFQKVGSITKVAADLVKDSFAITNIPKISTWVTMWAYAINSRDTGFSDPIQFRLRAVTSPKIELKSLRNLSNSGVELDFSYLDFGGDNNVSNEGVVFSTNSSLAKNPSGVLSQILISSNPRVFTVKLENLFAGSTYYFYGYSRNSGGYGYSPLGNFNTLPPSKPAIKLTNRSDANNVAFQADVEDFGGSGTATYGIVWSSWTSSPTILDSKLETSGVLTSSLYSTIPNLTSNVLYYFRAFITTPYGTIYSSNYIAQRGL